MVGIVIISTDDDQLDISTMDSYTREWTKEAAKGNCGWICSDCCCVFPEGMPDECAHGDELCTSIIKRDKAMSQKE